MIPVGACAMSQAYAPVDPWLDGILRFGGGYSNWLSNSTGQRGAVFDYVRNFSSAVEGLNAASVNSNLSSCVYVPPPQQGLGCKCVLRFLVWHLQSLLVMHLLRLREAPCGRSCSDVGRQVISARPACKCMGRMCISPKAALLPTGTWP